MNEKPNLIYIKELSAGSVEFENKLISILKREFPEERNEFISNYTAKAFNETAENVHKLKHKIGMLGFEKGYQTAVNFEDELKNGKTSLYSDFTILLDTIDNFLITLNNTEL